jgi:hypothetical protein
MGHAASPVTSTATPPSSAWFGPERQSALEDFWRVYDANIDLGQVMRESPELPELAHVAQTILGESGQDAQRRRAELRRAFEGDCPMTRDGRRASRGPGDHETRAAVCLT